MNISVLTRTKRNGDDVMKNGIVLCIVIVVCISVSTAQEQLFIDPCGFPDTTSLEFKIAASGKWGYGYDTLLYDLSVWKKSPFVVIDSIGATVQKRTMFMVTIQDTTKISIPRKRIWIHARTHPGEVQGTWVTNEIIKTVLSNSLLGKKLRDSCIFNIVPMYNPDGVELGNLRENANMIDIESNWDTTSVYPSQPEVTVLRNTFRQLMSTANPIRIALNMHSAYGTKRYFVYHTPTGTSPLFSTMEIKFIDTVRYNFLNAIQPYTFFVSWTATAAKQYPESWFWYNHKEKVLALTYEDMNDTSANSFDKTASAISRGAADYLGIFGIPVSVAENNVAPAAFRLEQNYPNPFNPNTTITYQIQMSNYVSLKVYDMLGREVETLVNETKEPGTYSVMFNGTNFSTGMYIARLQSVNDVLLRKMLLVK